MQRFLPESMPKPAPQALSAVLLVLVTAGLALRLMQIDHAAIEVDEFQHIHAAYLVASGQLPYRDFFEHHTPFYYLFGAWLIDPSSADFGTFRPHAYRYWFLHDEAQLMIPTEKLRTDLLQILADPAVRVVLRDRYFETVPPEVLRYLEDHFEDRGLEIWARAHDGTP